MTYRAIQILENVLGGKGLLKLVEDAWERVKKAALEEEEAQGKQDASDLPAQAQDIQDSLLALTK